MSPNGQKMDNVTPIAVVGMSFRGPGDATDTEGLLRMVAEGRESRSEIPKQKWNHDSFYHPDPSRYGTKKKKHNVKYGHWFEQDVYEFDAPFFNISAPEAIALDPQQRMLLECSYEAFENSGIPMSKVIGTNTSVFAACFATDYTDMLWRDPETVPVYQCTNSGFSRANMANRISYSFDLRGPSVTVDTACSGGLTALHLACQSLLSGDAKQAIAAGSSLILGPEVMVTMSMMRFLSPDGRCYAFDERANGYARGEGVAVLLLKRLDDALADGDTIRAIIRGTGCNQDGKTPGITMPNGVSQEELIRSVYEKTGLDPLETSYVECHGTGTQAGDTTETGAIRTVFGRRQPQNALAIGSVKTNIGHLEGASGLAGVIKSILMLENEIILPHRNFEKANPRIPLKEWGLRVPITVEPWTCSSPRRVSVNSFGYGGANVHAILESAKDFLHARGFDPNVSTRRSAFAVRAIQEALQLGPTNGHSVANGHSFTSGNGILAQSTPTMLFALSAFDPTAGEAWAGKLVEYVTQRQSVPDAAFLRSLAFTLSNRRTIHSWKAVVAASSSWELISQLKKAQFVNIPPRRNLGFVFTGQGAQWCGMGKELINAFPRFQESLQRCGEALVRLGAPFDVLEELQKDFETSQVNKAVYSQPLCTALQIALVDLLDSWDIHPNSVTGHSSGEIAAAYCAGAISLEDAMLLAYARGCATTDLARKGVDGTMAAVGMTREELSPILSDLRNGKAVIACSNSPSSITVSGDKSAIDELQQVLREQGVYNRRLVVGVAYHSHHMTLVADSYRAAISKIRASEGNKLDFFSSVTGKLLEKSKLGPEYWVSNMVGEVKFAQSLGQMANHQAPNRVQTLVEIGPHGALAGPIRQVLEADEGLTKSSIEYLSILTRKKNAVTTALSVASTLFVSGNTVQVSAVNQCSGLKIPPLIDLPSYAWNHSRTYSAESRISKVYRERENPRTDLLGVLDVHSSTLEPRWRQIIRLSELPWLRDHNIQSTIIYPAAGYITMAMEAARQRVLRAAPGTQVLGYQFRDVNISSALLIQETPGQVEVSITLKRFSESVRSPSDLWDEFSISSVSSENRWTDHCRGLIAVQTPPKTSNPSKRGEFYSRLSQIGMRYGPTFANIHDMRSAPGHCISRVEIPDTRVVLPMQYEQACVIHPCTLDSIFQTYLPALAAQMDELGNPVVPVCIEDMFIAHESSRQPGDILAAYSSTISKDNQFFTAEITVFDGPYEPGDRPVVHVGEMTLAALDQDGADESDDYVPPMVFNLKWAPDVDLLSKAQIIDIVGQAATTNLIEEIGAEAVGASSGVSENNRLAAGYLHLLAHKKPDLSVLTVGFQSGPAALNLLSLLSQLAGSVAPFKTFHHTDAEFDLDQVAKAKFPAWVDSITFKNLKTEGGIPKDTMRGVEGTYDVVVAFNVLGYSRGLSQSFSSASKLLMPSGRLLLVDHAPASSLATLPQDSLVGFISSEDDPSTAKSSLTVDLLARKVGYKTHQALSEGVMVFQTENEPSLGSNITGVLIVVDDEAQPAVDLVRLQTICEDIGLATEIVPLYDANPRPTQACIVLSELSRQVLAAPEPAEWEAIRTMAHRGAGLLWLTQGAGGDICSNPEASLVHGLARTIRSETGDRPIVTFDLDSIQTLGAEAAAVYIADVFQYMVQYASGSEVMEPEFIERNGVLQLPRLVEDVGARENLQSGSGTRGSKATPSLQRLDKVGSSRLFVGTPGLLDSLHFAPDDRTASHLENGKVEVEVKAVGINFKDVMMAMGQIQVDDLGCECSGIVSAVAGDVVTDPHGLRVGDRVMCLSSGSFCTRLRLDARLAARIPDSMSFETAAALPITHVTAYHSLHNIARLRRGETILIHAATGGLGQAFVEMSQLAGADIFVTVGNAKKKSFVMDRFGLAEERILYSRDMSFASDVMQLTGGRGADVIVNSLAGEALRQSWNCIAPYGRFVELGQRDITINTRLDMAPFARNASFTAYNLAYTMRVDPQAARDVLVEVLTLFSHGALRGPDPLETYGFSELQQAFRKMQTGRHMGKLVAIAKPDDIVKHIAVTTGRPLLRSDAAYLLVGGLGGIGRATALWMVSRGARHLVFLNRSGTESEAARDTVSALQAAGCTATVFACDVADAAQLASTLDKARQQLPPIRGVIQGAMVLRDCMLDRMSLEDYLAVLRPKMHGTWNLHVHLPMDLDFFLMESSVSGIIGNTAQASYAAANTFLDAFSRYRRSRGQPATTIDIGAVSGVGYIAQNEELKQAMQRQGFDFTDETRLMHLLEFAIGNSTREPHRAHIITGLGAYHPDTSLPALSTPMFSRYRMLSSCATNISNSNDTLRQALKQSKNMNSAVEVVLAALVDQIVSHTGVPIENVSTGHSLQDYGIDSLAAVEFRNWLSKEMESVVPIFELLAAESLAVLASKIAGRSRLVVSASGQF
ncbi:hypothetical protein N7519_004841 [Penicillium mononematosum]|uniref:uncharacterized protein n=1 Tax=Penicillium mononematosum TaxID=268346 RepID=UPI0025497B05|nr:uncharacterized protein N7519_004841 [Penicillium mononematosum]KAJ6189933.1 hypothetical protein N7519_004841 [Penicillium mononematosum]